MAGKIFIYITIPLKLQMQKMEIDDKTAFYSVKKYIVNLYFKLLSLQKVKKLIQDFFYISYNLQVTL